MGVKKITVNDIIIKWLINHGCDGLHNDCGSSYGSCGCGIDDIAPCGHGFDCVPAIKKGDLYYAAQTTNVALPKQKFDTLERKLIETTAQMLFYRDAPDDDMFWPGDGPCGCCSLLEIDKKIAEKYRNAAKYRLRSYLESLCSPGETEAVLSKQ